MANFKPTFFVVESSNRKAQSSESRRVTMALGFLDT